MSYLIVAELIQPQPILVKVQFLTVALSAAMNLYTCAWPADNLVAVVSGLIQFSYGDIKEK